MIDKPYSVNNLPRDIKSIHLGSSFNNSIDNLPESVEEIYIGDEECNFDTPINNLPHGLQTIYISKMSEQIDYMHFEVPPTDIYDCGSYTFNQENFYLAKKIFQNLDTNERIKAKNSFPRIFDWDKIGYALSCDI